jgi:hypothetical protein
MINLLLLFARFLFFEVVFGVRWGRSRGWKLRWNKGKVRGKLVGFKRSLKFLLSDLSALIFLESA